MKNIKRILSLVLTAVLTVSLPPARSRAELIIPPSPFGTAAVPAPGSQPAVPETTSPAAAAQPSVPESGDQPAAPAPGSQPASTDATSPEAVPQPPAPDGAGQVPQPPQTVQEPVIAAEGAVLIDGATGKVLFGRNENQQFYPASITKVMTALLVLERCS